jgi:integrase/recombinase XerD
MNRDVAQILSEQSACFLKYLEDGGMSPATLKDKRRILKRFVAFVEEENQRDVFTETFLERFQTAYGRTNVKKVLRPFSRYLYREGVINKAMGHYHRKLPDLFAAHLAYMEEIYPDNKWPHRIVLTALHAYLTERDIDLKRIKIVELDHFLAQTYGHLAIETQNKYRSCLRGFLKHLFAVGKIRKNLAPLLKNKRMFERTLPPRFLLPHEIKQLFAGMTYDTERDLRANAMVYLAFTLGLRPKEISRIELDNVRFATGELSLTFRKNDRSAGYPLSEAALKAVSAYVLCARPRGRERTLFLHLNDCKPLSNNKVAKEITACMRRAGLSASSYSLRHTYAQQLLETGRSVYEIKEMMGHKALKTTMRYLCIHTSLMRRVLFDETV